MFSPTGYVAEYQDGTLLPVADFFTRTAGLGESDGPARVARTDGLGLIDATSRTLMARHGMVTVRPLRNGE